MKNFIVRSLTMNRKIIGIKTITTMITLSIMTIVTNCSSMKVQSKSPFLGIYTINISENEIQEGNPSGSSSILAGTWEFNLYENGVYLMTLDGQHVAEGKCIFTDNQVFFTDERGKLACDCAGIYKWSVDGKSLKLEKIEDQCNKRNFILTHHPWINKFEF